MKHSNIATWTLAAALLTTPLISCTQKKEEPKKVYQIQTKDWGVKAEEKKNGDVKVEGYHKEGYGVIFEGRKDGSYDIRVKLPGDKK